MSAAAAPAAVTLHDCAQGAMLTVDLAAVAANTRFFASRTKAEVMAVVKADGFGHGCVPAARTALDNGATWLGVTSIAEGLALREAGLAAPMLSWLNPVDADFGYALEAGIDLAVPSLRHLSAVTRAAVATGRRGRVHLHLDVGMARDGADPAEWPGLCRAAFRAEQRGLLHVAGLMGHLGCADRPADPCNEASRACFGWGLQAARGAGLWYAPAATTLGLLAVGYADGLPRAASGQAEIMVRGHRCHVAGLISMDQTVIDLGDRQVDPGEAATVFGPGTSGEPTVADWATWAGTIEHEIVTGIGGRVHRQVTGECLRSAW